ncbi:MAG: FAD-dependent oxidoreductase [Clostridiales bacterium]|nr:FAD-dependent oxidoreductase [Clostridiales bacterium]
MIDIKTYAFDVIVAGAGPAGVAAALVSARQGMKTALIERYGCIGGGLTTMFVRPFLGGVGNPNIGTEIRQRIGEFTDFMTSLESAKCVLPIMLREAGVRVFLQTQVTGVRRKGAIIEAAMAHSRQGEIEFTAPIFIDATGDGDLAAYAGCEIAYGREKDGLVQPASIMFTIDGIDPEQKLLCHHEEDYRDLGDGREYLDLCHKACESGELPPSINIVRLYETGRQGERMVNATQFNHIRPLDPEHVFEAEYQLRQQIRQVVFFLKNNIPGFADIHVNGSSTTLGARESRRVIGDYILTGDDLIAGRKFEDAVVHNASFCIDIHNPDGAGQAETDGCPHLAQPYDIPYRSLRPLGVDNLLTAGRCISGDHRAHASYRVMNICMAMGQAAGAAASLAVKGGTGTRGVDIDELKQLTHTV